MTTPLVAAAPAGAVFLDGPPPLPRPYSLLASASAPEIQLVTNPRALAGGIAFWPYTPDTPFLWAPCLTGTYAEKDLDFINGEFDQEPFTAYLPVGCSATDATREELEERVRAVFEATESHAVERQLITGEVGTAPRSLGGAGSVAWDSGGDPHASLLALAALEQRIGVTGRRGIIHADPAVVTTWAVALKEEDGVLRTVANDTLVVAGSGYSFHAPSGGSALTQTTAYAFASGPILIVRDEARVLFSYDHSVNDALAIAERNYVVAWDGGLQVHTKVDLTA